MSDTLLRAELIKNIPELQDDETLLTECELSSIITLSAHFDAVDRHVHMQESQ
jgi:hypothetical protein